MFHEEPGHLLHFIDEKAFLYIVIHKNLDQADILQASFWMVF